MREKIKIKQTFKERRGEGGRGIDNATWFVSDYNLERRDLRARATVIFSYEFMDQKLNAPL